MTPNGNYGFWVIMMCHCRPSLVKIKMYHLMNDTDNRGGHECVREDGIWEISVTFP